MFSLIRKKYILLILLLFTICFSQTYSDQINTKGLFSHSYKLQIIGSAGTFGSRRYTFHIEHKRDELYSAIAELNQMGTPVV